MLDTHCGLHLCKLENNKIMIIQAIQVKKNWGGGGGGGGCFLLFAFVFCFMGLTKMSQV
jgi:hypothetical protein